MKLLELCIRREDNIGIKDAPIRVKAKLSVNDMDEVNIIMENILEDRKKAVIHLMLQTVPELGGLLPLHVIRSPDTPIVLELITPDPTKGFDLVVSFWMTHL